MWSAMHTATSLPAYFSNGIRTKIKILPVVTSKCVCVTRESIRMVCLSGHPNWHSVHFRVSESERETGVQPDGQRSKTISH